MLVDSLIAFSRALERVQALVAEYEAAKKQESERRTAYKNEKNELEDEINKLEARLKASSDTDPADSRKWKEVDEQYQLVSDRLQKQRLVLVMPPLFSPHSIQFVFSLAQAKKVREISALSRRIDDIPSSSELAQYRQSFFQLYSQSSVLYRQTKQNFTLYNTFTDMIDYMTKEIMLIESINEGYPQ